MVNGHRPSAITTNGSADATSVHPAGRENNTPSASWRSTRSSPQFWRCATNSKSWPDSGWSWCVTGHVGTGHLDGVSLTMWSNAVTERFRPARAATARTALILGQGHLLTVLAEYRSSITATGRTRACSRTPPRLPGHAVDITARLSAGASSAG